MAGRDALTLMERIDLRPTANQVPPRTKLSQAVFAQRSVVCPATVGDDTALTQR